MRNRFIRNNWFLVLLTAAALLAIALNLEKIFGAAGVLFRAVTPIIAGFSLAFILNVPMRFFESRVFYKLCASDNKKIKRLGEILSFAVTLILFLGIIALAILVIIPELLHTAEMFITSLPGFAEGIMENVQGLLKKFNMPEDTINTLTVDWSLFITKLLEFLQTPTVANTATNITTGLIGGVVGMVMALVIAVYVLLEKRRIGRFSKRFFKAILPENAAHRLFELSKLSDTAFSGFIRGQFLNALILGAASYLGMIVFGFDYPEAISVIVGLSSLIPIVGPVIGAGLGALLIVMTSPIQALFFLLFIVVLQQVEGNLVYPRIVGKNLGVPGIIVLSAVIIGSGLYGIPGILIGIPLSAVLYALLTRYIENKLRLSEGCGELKTVPRHLTKTGANKDKNKKPRSLWQRLRGKQ